MKRAEFKCQGREAEVLLYDEIGSSWGDGISAKMFVEDLNALGDVDRITVRINSPGGDVFDGDAMYHALRMHPAEIHTHVDGLAASAASLVAMAGDTVVMAENGRMMIHNPKVFIWGGSKDLLRMVGLLDSIADAYIGTYLKQIGEKSTRGQLIDWMDAETWFSAGEAIDAGLADEVAQPMRVAAMVHPDRYKNAPRDIVSDQAPGMDAKVAWRLAAARRELMMLG